VVAGTTLSLSAVADSHQPVTLTSLTPSVCTISGNTVSAVAAGVCNINALQPGYTIFARAVADLVFMVFASANPPLPTAPLLYMLAAIPQSYGTSLALFAIDTSNYQTVNVVPISYSASSLVVAPDGSRVYVDDNNSGRVYAYDAATLRITGSAHIEQFLSAMAISPDGRTLYVATRGADELLSVVNTANMQLTGTVNTGTVTYGMKLSADGSKLYLAGATRTSVLAAISTASNTVTATVPLTSISAYDIVLSPAGDRAWVSNYASGDIETVDLVHNTLLQTFTQTNNGVVTPNMAIAPDGKTVYVYATTSTGASVVTVLDTASNKATANVAIGYPFALTITPDGKKVLAGDSNGVDAVDTNTNAVTNVSTACCAVAMVVGAPPTVDASQINPEAGYWWNPSQGGNGFTIERGASGSVFFASYLYSSNGTALWYAAGPAQMTGSTFSAPLTAYSGGETPSGTYQPAATGPSPGNVSITFTAFDTATLTWPGGTLPIQRYEFADGGLELPVPATQPQSGYWWNPAEGGRGYTVEVQNGTVFVAAYMYDTNGNPVWYASGPGTLTSGNVYQGTLNVYSGGKTLTGNYQSPASPASAGNITIQFTSNTTAMLTLPNGRQIPIQRYGF
jgi:YVTN family beta-propeller protein